MGCCSSETESEKAEREFEEALKEGRVRKLLFLGSGGSGKSTMFKQIRTMHGDGWETKDKLTFVDHVHAQIIEQMRLAVERIDDLRTQQFDEEEIKKEIENLSNKKQGGEGGEGGEVGGEGGGEGGSGKAAVKKEIHEVKISYNDLELTDVGKEAADNIQIHMQRLTVTQEVAKWIKALWAERAIKCVFALRSTLKIEDTCQYFWDEVDRIAANGYVPNDYDILAVRYRTTGVIEQKVKIKDLIFHIFDVGGQKSERKKWIHCYEDVTAVLYCASLSCYNEVMFEDEEVNSMVDQIELFGKTVNNKWFKDTTIILLLTKKDIFAQKIQRIPITDCPALKQYAGVNDSNDEAIEYISEAFKSKNDNRNKQVLSHVVDCTDLNNVETIFNEIRKEVVNATLARAELI